MRASVVSALGLATACRLGFDARRDLDASLTDAAGDSTVDGGLCVGYTTVFGGHNYRLTANASFDAANADCGSDGGHLVKVETQSEDDFIRTTFTSNGYVWIGLSDPTHTNTYVWIDGSPLGAFNNFPGGMPPVSASDCIDTNGTWDAYDCSLTNHGGVCECE